VQGYYFGKPTTIEEILKTLAVEPFVTCHV
jgi:EAL domain-containing protein (putative c-di-GMP-specific phosphodiesterase class I)